jgi:hypothetical protein
MRQNGADKARVLYVLCCALLFAGSLSGREHAARGASVTGTLSDGGPIRDAEIDLQSLRDEHCAKIFNRKVPSDISTQAQQEVRDCIRDLASTQSDAEGHYKFSGLLPGWYAVQIVWSIAEKPTRPQSFEHGEWEVINPGYKDKTGKYDAFAQGKAFLLSGETDLVKDFLLDSAPVLKPATKDEETVMTGRLLGAIEDAGGGYTKEAISRFSWINKELERREYSLRTRWTAHFWYAQALLDSGKSKAALEILRTAEQEASALTETEREQTAELTRKVQDKLSKK